MRADAGVIRVLIADDHAVVREGIRHVLARDGGFAVVGEAADGREAVTLARSLEPPPDVVVIDLSMPVLSGLEAVAELRETMPAVRVLVLSIHEDEEYVLRSVRAGALGYLRKDSSPAELREAIRCLKAGGTAFSAPAARAPESGPGEARRSDDASRRVASLTARERDVLTAIASGLTNRDIAARFGLSVRTVESHREALMRKLGLRGGGGVAALTKLALDAGLVSTKPRG